MRGFTNWLELGEYTDTHYGCITNEDWLDKEINRLNRAYGDVLFFKRIQQYQGRLCGCIMTKLKEHDERFLIDLGFKLR